MDEQKKIVSAPEKKSFWRMFGNFLMYGGWLLILVLGLGLMILFSSK